MILKIWGGIWGAMISKYGVEYGVLMILKIWGEIWGANDFENMGRNMGCQ